MKYFNEHTVGVALGFAAAAHIKQKRKYTGLPYITHCQNVARLVLIHLEDSDVVSAALMHDVIEDCGITADEMCGVFGNRITELVLEVTDISKPTDGNRVVRKTIDREHLAKSSPAGATIKLADIIDNTSSIVKHDPDFAQIYLKEKRLLLPLLKHGNKKLWELANKIVAI